LSDSSKRLGYGGSAEIDGEQVLITSGGFDTAKAPSYLEALDITRNADSRSRMQHADGTWGFTGSVSLDVTDAFMNVLQVTKLLDRGYTFDVGIHDGESAQEMSDCLVSSLTLQGAPGGLINASLSFIGPTIPIVSVGVANAFKRDDVPHGYWYSGNTDVESWTFTMNQAVTPVYLNNAGEEPKYLKYGLVDYQLSVVTYEQLQTHSVINIVTRAFTLTGNTTSEGYQFNGPDDVSRYSHTLDTAASIAIGSGDTIITQS